MGGGGLGEKLLEKVNATFFLYSFYRTFRGASFEKKFKILSII
jgi:hypothetical protein